MSTAILVSGKMSEVDIANYAKECCSNWWNECGEIFRIHELKQEQEGSDLSELIWETQTQLICTIGLMALHTLQDSNGFAHAAVDLGYCKQLNELVDLQVYIFVTFLNFITDPDMQTDLMNKAQARMQDEKRPRTMRQPVKSLA